MKTKTETEKNAKPPGINGHSFPKKIGVIYSEVKREYFPTEAQYLTEKDALQDAEIVARYIEKLGIKTKLYPGLPKVFHILKKDRVDMVINLVDSINGQEYLSSFVPGILEAMDIPYTGVGILGRSLDYNKFLVKDLLQNHGVPVPNFQLMTNPQVPLQAQMRFPLISKLNEIHGAVEITENAVSHEEKHLRERLKFLIDTYKQPVLVEEFIAGREFTAILLEGLNKKVYLAEKIFNRPQEGMAFATYEAQWLEVTEETDWHYEKIQDTLLGNLTKHAFDIIHMNDYGKFDIRFDQSGRYYFIDANTNPAFGPKETDAAISTILGLYDISFVEILKRLILNTMRDQVGKERLPAVGE